MMRAIGKHARDAGLIAGVVLVAVVVGGYILSNQRFYLPHWVPVVGSDFVDYKAEFSTAQSVTPGQGQTVQVAGVDVGEISNVDLVGGKAVVTMKVRRRFTPIFRDATALLRPKTGLNDMVVQLSPGSRSSGRAPAGFVIPVSRTLPNVNFDEILSVLDADTRNFLAILVTGGGEALGGQGRQLAATLKRFKPTARYTAQITSALRVRQRNLKRAVHNFSLLATALGAKDDELAGLVDASNRVFSAFASQDVRLREALGLLPGALGETNRTLAKVDRLARVLGPTLGGLRPAARALGPSLRQTRPFLRTTTPIIRDQLRPFARDTLPTVKALRPVAADLAVITPRLDTSLRVVNRALNELAYNPPGKEEGFLFWASWANHAGASIFSNQDAQGPIRRGLVIANCTSLGILQGIGAGSPLLGTLSTLLNPPPLSTICPTAAPLGLAARATSAKGRVR
jgi:phospholipid/cholesterol/gamma-HCH transport system substrate-binding protein